MVFSSPNTVEQSNWLRTTQRPLRSISFHSGDPASCQLLHDPGILASSEGSLQAAHNVRITADGAMLDKPVSLARFGHLRSLSLSHANRWCLQPGQLPELPVSLTGLVLDSGHASAPLPTGLQLQHLTALQCLGLYNHSCHWTREGKKMTHLPLQLQHIELRAPLVQLHQFLPNSSGLGPSELTVLSRSVWVQFIDRGVAQYSTLSQHYGQAGAGAGACSSKVCAGVRTLNVQAQRLSIEYVPSVGASGDGQRDFLASGGLAHLARLVRSPDGFSHLSLSPAAPGAQIEIVCVAEERLGAVVAPRLISKSCKYSIQALAQELSGPCRETAVHCNISANGQRLLLSKPEFQMTADVTDMHTLLSPAVQQNI